MGAQFVGDICCSLTLDADLEAWSHTEKTDLSVDSGGLGPHASQKSDDFLQYALGGCQITGHWGH